MLVNAFPDREAKSLRPTDIHVCRWASNPFFCGSYSLLNVGAFFDGKSTFEDLQKPVGSLLFAGEAFDERYSGYL